MVKRIKHNDLSWYFMRPREELPAAYVRSCEKFLKEISDKLQASSHETATIETYNKNRKV